MVKINTKIIVTYEGYPDEDNEISIESSLPEEKNEPAIDLHMQALDFAIKCIKEDFMESFTKITRGENNGT